MAEC
jgi:hypothetical protein